MNIRDHASQFGVTVLSTDSNWGPEAKTYVSRAGYDVHLIVNYSGIIEHLKQKNPHVIVFSLKEIPDKKLSPFLKSILQINPETKFVVIAELALFDSIRSFEQHGVEQFVSSDKTHIGLRVAAAVDRICEKLYYIYQNEQLLNEVKEKKTQPASDATMVIPTAAPLAPAPAPTSATVPLSKRLTAYQSSETPEMLLQNFFEATGVKQVVYFKFIPAVSTFVAIQAAGYEAKDIQGVGCQIDGLSVKDLGTQVSLGVVPPPLQEVIDKNLKIQNARLHPLFGSGQLNGVLVYPGNLPENQKTEFSEELSLLAMAYSYLELKKKVEWLQVQDPVTEVFNRKYYDLKISEEVERALRIRQAVSVLKVAIDDFFEIEQTMGETARDLLLKKIAQIVQKSNRTNDIVARTGHNEITVLMPHSSRQGALTRAERIRRMVESSMTLETGAKVSISIGISEYPTLCKSASTLEESAAKALAHISSRGGNKICVFKAPAGHAPEFPVPTEQG